MHLHGSTGLLCKCVSVYLSTFLSNSFLLAKLFFHLWRESFSYEGMLTLSTPLS